MRGVIAKVGRSPGLLVAVLALVAALAGTAVAAPGATTSKLNKKKVVRIADREIDELALSNDVVTHVESVQVPDGGAEGVSAECVTGERMISGGATPVGTAAGEKVVLVASGPIVPGRPGTGDLPFTVVPADGSSLSAWGGFLRNEEGNSSGGPGGTATLNVFAVCAR